MECWPLFMVLEPVTGRFEELCFVARRVIFGPNRGPPHPALLRGRRQKRDPFGRRDVLAQRPGATRAGSAGNPILDKSAVSAFRKWRFKPGTVSKVRTPVEFSLQAMRTAAKFRIVDCVIGCVWLAIPSRSNGKRDPKTLTATEEIITAMMRCGYGLTRKVHRCCTSKVKGL